MVDTISDIGLVPVLNFDLYNTIRFMISKQGSSCLLFGLLICNDLCEIIKNMSFLFLISGMSVLAI